MASRTQSGPITELPAGWRIEIKDQGEHIGEIWMIIRRPSGIGTTKVYDRNSPFGETLLELALAV